MGVRHTETSLIIWSAYAREGAPQPPTSQAAPPGSLAGSIFGADQLFDAGDQGCAFGPLDEIARIMRRMQPGQTLEVHATDPTVSADLTAWCRMTGHTLVEQRGPHYLLRRKES
ncbi:MAG: sulfurtransferase TusA family protein [Caldilineaceae bacterium]|nr:sulfurtransferase TusA family protein [Caldilineaceae bacterium]